MADVEITDQGSLIIFAIKSTEADEWVQDNVEIPSIAWLGDSSFVVEHNYADALIEGFTGAGFVVENAEA